MTFDPNVAESVLIPKAASIHMTIPEEQGLRSAAFVYNIGVGRDDFNALRNILLDGGFFFGLGYEASSRTSLLSPETHTVINLRYI